MCSEYLIELAAYLHSRRRLKDRKHANGGQSAYALTPVREWLSGGVLLSHPVPGAVPSALKGLASGFGMRPGVSLSPWPP
jgi:hypothetical protein